jgi:hypothetical protein
VAARRRRRAYWLAVLLAVVLLAGGTTVAVSSYLAVPSPASVVKAYFAALSRDDASKALAYGDVPAGARGYLTKEVLRDQLGIGSIGRVDVRSVVQLGDRATVNIQYPLRLHSGTSSITDAVPMLRRGGRWRLTESATVVAVAFAGAQDRLTFAGTAVPSGPVALFPGALPVRFDTANLALAPSAAMVRFADPRAHTVTVVVSPAGQATITAAIGTAVRACLASTSTDALCPVPDFDYDVRVVPGSLHGTLASAPTVVTTVQAAAAGTIDAAGTFQVEGTYTTLDFNNQPSQQSGRVTVSFDAHCFAATAGTVSWVVPS